MTRYPVKLWSCHERLLNGTMRTNNNAEIFHKHHSEQFVLSAHPRIPKFLQGLQSQQKLTRNAFSRLSLADEKKEKPAMTLRNERFRKALADYDARKVMGNFTVGTVMQTIANVLLNAD